MHKSLLLFQKSRILNCFTVIGESHVSACYLRGYEVGLSMLSLFLPFIFSFILCYIFNIDNIQWYL